MHAMAPRPPPSALATAKSRLGILLLLFVHAAPVSAATICYEAAAKTPSAGTNPTCGDGVIQPGEVCDDGNRRGGDGCNAWCSGFDRMTAPCTMAGRGSVLCKAGETTSRSIPALSTFCDLTTIAVSGNTAYFADGGALFEYELMTDTAPAQVIRQFASTTGQSNNFQRFCGILPSADGVVAHECRSQALWLFPNPRATSGTKKLQDLSALLVPVQDGGYSKSHFDPETGRLLVVGRLATTAGGYCMGVYAAPLDDALPVQLVTKIPCLLMGRSQLEVDDLQNPSYDATGMIPDQVAYEPCPPGTGGGSCYVVRAARADMHRVAVYIPVAKARAALAAGSTVPIPVLKYRVSTDAFYGIVHAGSFRRQGADARSVYSLEGPCLYYDAGDGMSPRVALGESCTLAEANGWECSTPLKNAFTTDVTSSPFLLPGKYSASLTAAELREVYAEDTLPQFTSQGGVSVKSLFQQLMENVYDQTRPVDFAELPGTRDLIYITRTAIHFISTKGFILQDYRSVPYCIPHPAVLCPTGYYGGVGGACTPCPTGSTGVAGRVMTVPEQIQCVARASSSGGSRRLLSNLQTPPSVTFSSRVSKSVTSAEFRLAVCRLLAVRGQPCASAASTGDEALRVAANMDADGQQTTSESLHTQLIKAAALNEAKPIKKAEIIDSDMSEEHFSWVSGETALLDALFHTQKQVAFVAPDPPSDVLAEAGLNRSALVADPQLALCDIHAQRARLGKFVQCAIKAFKTAAKSAAGARRLLATTDDSSFRFVDQVPLTLVSSTVVQFAGGAAAQTTTPAPSEAADGSKLTVPIGVVAGVAGACALVVLLLVLYFFFSKRQVVQKAVSGKRR